MTFLQSVKKKFDKGAREHKQPWDLEHVDARQEMKWELEDLYNYAKLYSTIDRKLSVDIMIFAKETWNKL